MKYDRNNRRCDKVLIDGLQDKISIKLQKHVKEIPDFFTSLTEFRNYCIKVDEYLMSQISKKEERKVEIYAQQYQTPSKVKILQNTRLLIDHPLLPTESRVRNTELLCAHARYHQRLRINHKA